MPAVARPTAPPTAAKDTSAGVRPTPPLSRELGWLTINCLLTIVGFSVIFPPLELWPLAFVCLAPWAIGVCRTHRAWLVYWCTFATGWTLYLINLHWLMPVTGLGYAALAFYLALYWPITAWAVRTGRRHGVSPVWTLPVTWVACEYLRAWVMSGFPWLFVGHAFYKQLTLIQIADLAGVYGVTFLAVMVTGVVVELRLARGAAARRRRQTLLGGAACVVLIGAALLYGRMRINSAAFTDGPKVAVVQEDFPLSNLPPYGEHPYVVFSRFMALGAEAAQQRPDLLVFPETAWNATQNIGFVEVPLQAAASVPQSSHSFGKLCHEATAALARGDYATVNRVIARFEQILNARGSAERGERPYELPRLPEIAGPPVTVVVGCVSVDIHPEAVYPQTERFNSALVYDPDGVQRRQRYDKIHLVPFGEVVPFRYGKFHWLYVWLNGLSPFSGGGRHEYSLSYGREYTVFDLQTPERLYRFGTPICYEDVMPYIIRNYVWDGGLRRVDFLVNISNDGWFIHSAELPQHLAICAFRAVENRIGIARAVNTGISGFIDPNGRIHDVVEREGRSWGAGIVGYRAAAVQLDTRSSFYGRYGDVFAQVCLILTAVLWFDAVGTRWVIAFWRRLVARWRRKRTA